MTSETVIKAEAILFSELFFRGRFAVPWHQRYYDWNQDDVRSLLHDIREALEEDRKCYFLGPVMLVSENTPVDRSKQWEINDGQQRMVTLSLMCAALCRRFAQEAEESQREGLALRILFDLNANVISNLDEAESYIPRITPPRNDATHYQQMIRGKCIGTNGNLTTAWNEIDAFVCGLSLAKAKKYFDFLLQRLEVACLWLPASVDANAVYETINWRGKRLEDLDLIRNYLYSHFNTGEDAARRETVHESLEGIRTQIRSSAKTAAYMRCYFQCQYGFLPEKSFYRKTRDTIRSTAYNQGGCASLSDYIFELIADLSSPKCVELFRTMTASNPNIELIGTFQNDSKTTSKSRNLGVFLRELHEYKVTQPLVFAMLMKYLNETDRQKKKRIARITHKNLSRLTSFVLRTAFVGPKFEPSQFEKEFSNFARKIVAARDIPEDSFADFLHDCDRSANGVLQDIKFKAAMESSAMTGKKKIRLLLLAINSAVQNDFNVLAEQRCTIEHILPDSKEHWPGWHGFKDVNCADWINRIGNLTLLGSKDNKPGQNFNSSFAKKREIYQDSAIRITRMVAAHTDWSPDSIDKRQQDLARRATEIWQF